MEENKAGSSPSFSLGLSWNQGWGREPLESLECWRSSIGLAVGLRCENVSLFPTGSARTPRMQELTRKVSWKNIFASVFHRPSSMQNIIIQALSTSNLSEFNRFEIS